MRRTHLIAFFSLLLTLLLLPGCDSESDAISTEADRSSQVEVTADPDPIADSDPTLIGDASDITAAEPVPPKDPVAPSAFIVIQNAGPRDPQLLVRQLQQVLPKTQVVKQVQSPDNREIKLEVTNIKDVRALANKIPFASVETVDVPNRLITVDFDL
jgi:hypothetical protein